MLEREHAANAVAQELLGIRRLPRRDTTGSRGRSNNPYENENHVSPQTKRILQKMRTEQDMGEEPSRSIQGFHLSAQKMMRPLNFEEDHVTPMRT